MLRTREPLSPRCSDLLLRNLSSLFLRRQTNLARLVAGLFRVRFGRQLHLVLRLHLGHHLAGSYVVLLGLRIAYVFRGLLLDNRCRLILGSHRRSGRNRRSQHRQSDQHDRYAPPLVSSRFFSFLPWFLPIILPAPEGTAERAWY